MNSDNLVELVQKSFRITVGATTSLVEVLQNPDKRQANVSEIRSKLNERLEEWENKGEITEQEARKFVDTIWQKQQNGVQEPGQSPENRNFNINVPNFSDTFSQFIRFPTTNSPVTPSSDTSSPSGIDPRVQTELQTLTAQIAAMRSELEDLRRSRDS